LEGRRENSEHKGLSVQCARITTKWNVLPSDVAKCLNSIFRASSKALLYTVNHKTVPLLLLQYPWFLLTDFHSFIKVRYKSLFQICALIISGCNGERNQIYRRNNGGRVLFTEDVINHRHRDSRDFSHRP